jgi:NAD(P)-dependent dehydrogenase (short-subunit alcohol dehydrogenase family)
LITGPSKAGIGAQVAISLASASPKLVILAGRNAAKVSPVIDVIKKVNPAVRVEFVPLDLSRHESVRKSVEAVKAVTENIDVLINNAGVMATRKFTLSYDGIESQFAINYLSPFLFTNLLLKEGIVSSGAVILNVGSLGYQMADIDFEDINFKVSATYLRSLRGESTHANLSIER